MEGYTQMNVDDLKKAETAGAFAQGYSLMAWDADSGQYEKVTGYVVSADGLRVELQTDSDECDPSQCDCVDTTKDAETKTLSCGCDVGVCICDFEKN